MKRVSVLLVVVTLILGVVSCEGERMYEVVMAVNPAGSGTAIDLTDASPYPGGTCVRIQAEAAVGYEFSHWSASADGEDMVNRLEMPKLSETAFDLPIYVVAQTVIITANFVAVHGLTVTSTDGGTVSIPGEGTYTYAEGTAVDLVAIPDAGYQFIGWTGDVDDVVDIEAATTVITVNGACTITANFAMEVWDWYDLDDIRDDLGRNYVLMVNLDATTAGYEELASPIANGGRGWQPIGTDPDPFVGTFDGQRHEISDLFINRPDEVGVGLFGYVGEGGVVDKLGIADGFVVGDEFVGAHAGRVTYGVVAESFYTGTLYGDFYVGGLVGWNSGTVNKCYCAANVSGIEAIGGLAGVNRGYIGNSYSASEVSGNTNIGGLVGINEGGTVSFTDATGELAGTESDPGGLIGWNNDGTVSNSFWDTETTGTTESDGGTGKTTTEMRDINTFLEAGWNITAVADPDIRNLAYIWNIVADETYPFLSWEPVS